MKKGRIIILLSIFLLARSLAAAPVFAQVNEVTEPSFPSCDSPQGALKVYYPEGVHGIPGDYSQNSGSDAVYILSEGTLTQCFCADNGDGTQTNWWKVSSLTFDEIELLKKEGWIYVPDGSVWGLDEEPYMARNSEFECSEEEEDNDDDDDDDEDDEDDDKESGDVLGIGAILGLAATGNIVMLGLAVSVSVLSLFSLIKLLRYKK